MSEQRTDAAERSAHVERGAAPAATGPVGVVNIGDEWTCAAAGVMALRDQVERLTNERNAGLAEMARLRAEVEALTHERDAAREHAAQLIAAEEPDGIGWNTRG